MISKSDIKRNIHKFKEWLSERGAQVLEPTNEWELVRFKAGNETSIIYTNKSGNITFVGDSENVFSVFKVNGQWRAMPSTKRRTNGIKAEVKFLLKRDGNKCFFCNKEMTQEDTTREHLISVTHGGPDHVSNLVLAHRLCNQEAGNLSLMEKIKIHVSAIAKDKK